MTEETLLAEIVAALAVIYDIRSSSDQRSQAQQFCDKVKHEPTAPMIGKVQLINSRLAIIKTRLSSRPLRHQCATLAYSLLKHVFKTTR
jgi:hypothetical protein